MRLREFAKRAWYFGLRYKCQVCGARTRSRKTYSFDLPVLREKDVVGGEHNPNDDCPICFANQRSRLLYSYFTRKYRLQRGAKVLHVAPELALYRHLFKRSGVEYHPADLSPDRYREIPGVKKVDITDIVYLDKSFDVILCNHVLEHVPDDRRAMRELHRVLKDDGIAVLQVPLGMRLTRTDEDPSVTDEKERERRFGQFDHVRIYEERDYLRRLHAAGFEVEITPAQEIAGPEGLRRYELNPRERLIVARRRALAKRRERTRLEVAAPVSSAAAPEPEPEPVPSPALTGGPAARQPAGAPLA